MQNALMHIFVQIGQRALEKSRAYYYPLTTNMEDGKGALSDLAFAAMLKEIDAFSAQFCAAQAPGEGLQVQTESQRMGDEW